MLLSVASAVSSTSRFLKRTLSYRLRVGLDESDEVALGVGEHRNAGASRHLCGAHHRTAPETLDLAQRCLQVSDLYVDGDVPSAANRARTDTAVNAALTTGVRHRVGRRP